MASKCRTDEIIKPLYVFWNFILPLIFTAENNLSTAWHINSLLILNCIQSLKNFKYLSKQNNSYSPLAFSLKLKCHYMTVTETSCNYHTIVFSHGTLLQHLELCRSEKRLPLRQMLCSRNTPLCIFWLKSYMDLSKILILQNPLAIGIPTIGLFHVNYSCIFSS